MMGQSCLSALWIMSSGKHFGLRKRDPPSSCLLGLAWHRPGMPPLQLSLSERSTEQAEPGPSRESLITRMANPILLSYSWASQRRDWRTQRQVPSEGYQIATTGLQWEGGIRTHMAHVEKRGTGSPGVSLLRIRGSSNSTPFPPPPPSQGADSRSKLPSGTMERQRLHRLECTCLT